MPQIYLNGGAPNRLGFNFTTTSELLNEIKTQLTAAGWTATLDQITANRKLIMRGTSGTHNCWIRFIVVDRAGVTDGKTINLSGDQTGTEATISPNIGFNFIETASNRLWMAADDDSGCLAIESFEQQMKGGYFGFVDRLEPSTDQWGWGVGDLSVSYNAKYVAKSAFNGTNWKQLGDDYGNAADYNSANNLVPSQGIFDRFTTCHRPFSTYTTVGNNNAGLFAYNGAVNGLNNKPVIGSFFLIEGRGSAANYASPGNNAAPILFYRGEIKHACTGIASAPPRGQFITNDNKVYLSVGGQAWQGFRIE